MRRRDFLGSIIVALMGIIFPWKKEKRFHHEWYTTITVEQPELMGYKGSDFVEGGYVYAPYIPMYITRLG